MVEVTALFIIPTIHNEGEESSELIGMGVAPSDHAQSVIIIVASHDCRSSIFFHNIHVLHLRFWYRYYMRGKDQSGLEVFEGVEVSIPEVRGFVEFVHDLLECVGVGDEL